jgi:hypothetical protein
MDAKRKRAQNGQALMLLALTGVAAAVFIAVQGSAVRAEKEDEDDGPVPYPPYLDEGYPEDAHPTDKQKSWALATCAMVMDRNSGSHYVLGGRTNSFSTAVLKQAWNIDSKETLLDWLYKLECGGYRRFYDQWVEAYEARSPEEQERARRESFERGGTVSNRMDVMLAMRGRFKDTGLVGRDFSRYVLLCGYSYRAGYLTEKEAWKLIMPAARLLQKAFSSWNELADNYLEGRRFWSLDTYLQKGERMRNAVNHLKWHQSSSRRRLKWDLNLLPEEQQDDGSKEFRLGRMYFDSFGHRTLPEDHVEAVRLFTVAAGKGNLDAMFWLGLCNQNGFGGLKPDDEQAAVWYKKAAELGDTPSMVELARLLYCARL